MHLHKHQFRNFWGLSPRSALGRSTLSTAPPQTSPLRLDTYTSYTRTSEIAATVYELFIHSFLLFIAE